MSAGCKVSALDVSREKLEELKEFINSSPSGFPSTASISYYLADISSEPEMVRAFEQMVEKDVPVQCCVALASLDLSVLDHHANIIDIPLAQFKRTIDVNLTGTFLTAQLWQKHLAEADFKRLGNKTLIVCN